MNEQSTTAKATADPRRLARFGGLKVRTNPMPGRFAFADDELAAVQEVFAHYRARGVDFGYQGHFEDRYCETFVRHLGASGYADAVATGTGALFVALAALQLPKGSHVVTSPITDPGTVNAIILNGLVPVVMDSMPDRYNAGPEQFSTRITSQTRALVIVHSAGVAAPVDEMMPIARAKGIKVLEDCSQSHGARLKGQQIGTFGDIAAFSTMYRKNHATGGCGGVIFTRNEELYHLVRAHADRGKPFWKEGYNDKDPKQFLFPALNWNLDELSAAIGIKTLGKLDDVNRRRREFLRILCGELKQQSTICTPSAVSDSDAPFFFPIFVDRTRITCPVREFAETVAAEGISINPHYDYVVSEWTYAKPHLADDFATPNAVAVRDASFNLLFHENFGAAEAKDIATAIAKVERHFARP
jgi:perosamine synthetase